MVTDAELQIALAYVQAPESEPVSAGMLTRWERFAQVVLASNEFMYVD